MVDQEERHHQVVWMVTMGLRPVAEEVEPDWSVSTEVVAAPVPTSKRRTKRAP